MIILLWVDFIGELGDWGEVSVKWEWYVMVVGGDGMYWKVLILLWFKG